MIATSFRFKHILLYFICLLTFPNFVFPQYVRKGNYLSEQQRRSHYAIDDFISYSSPRRFTSMVAGSHYLYFGSLDGGIWRYHIYDNYWDYPYTTSSGLPSNRITGLAYDKSNSFLWAYTPDDIAVLNPASKEWMRKSDNPSWPYSPPAEDEYNKNVGKEILFGRTELSSLPTFFANGDYSIVPDWILMDHQFQEFPISGYMRDRHDRIWFLVEGFGVGRGDLYSQRASFYPLGLPDIVPRAIAYQGDDIWIGGEGYRNAPLTAIARWPFKEPGWDYFQARQLSYLPSDNVRDILVTGDSAWFATDYGVSLFDVGNSSWKNFKVSDGLVSNNVLDLEKLGDYLYIATAQGISRLHLAAGNVHRIKDRRFANLSFNKISRYRETLWAATGLGIYKFTEKFGWQYVEARSPISEYDVTAVDGYKDEIWFASPRGVSVYRLKTDDWESYPQLAFEIDAPYRDIKVNKKAVWVATASGLLKFHKENRYWRLFTREDGLLDNNCHQLMLDGEYIWIVTDNGVTQFYWDHPFRID